MAKWITYQEDVLRIYNSMRKKGEEFKDPEGHCMHLIELPKTKEMYIVASTKRNGDGLYQVLRVDALSDNEEEYNGSYNKNKSRVIMPSLFNKPVSEFVPATYEIIGKSLHNSIIIHRDGSLKSPINGTLKAQLTKQIEQFSKK